MTSAVGQWLSIRLVCDTSCSKSCRGKPKLLQQVLTVPLPKTQQQVTGTSNDILKTKIEVPCRSMCGMFKNFRCNWMYM